MDASGFNIGERYRFHLDSPHVRVWDYIIGLHDSQLAGMAGKRLLYFDTCYWNNLCDVRIGHKDDARYTELFELLTALRNEGRILCIASAALLTEIDLQTDDQTRREAAALVSRFTDNICLIDAHGAMRLEFKEHIMRRLLREKAPSLKSRYFTRPAWIFGVSVPAVSEARSYDRRVLIAKMGADLAWSHTFSRLLAERNGFKEHSLSAEIAAALRQAGQEWHTRSLKYDAIRVNIQSLYTERLLGELRSILEELDDEYPQLADKLKDPARTGCEKSVKEMPHVQVLASVFAELIVNKPGSITANDVVDVEHATMALPLCDVLFLDGGATHWLTSRREAIAKKHDKLVFGSIDDALVYLRGLKAEVA
jgi:hypothetical protein